MIDQEEGARLWEPWQPRVGQRVRINVSPECRHAHADSVQGKEGVVAHILGGPGEEIERVNRELTEDGGEPLSPEEMSHPYHVEIPENRQRPKFDTRTLRGFRDMLFWGDEDNFAAIELEPLDD